MFLEKSTDDSVDPVEIPAAESNASIFRNLVLFGALIVILVFSNWTGTGDTADSERLFFQSKWFATGLASVVLGLVLVKWLGARLSLIAIGGLAVVISIFLAPGVPNLWFSIGFLVLFSIALSNKGPTNVWVGASWGFAKQMLPLLLVGVLVAGFLLGRPGSEGLVPSDWIAWAVGGNSVRANFFASFAGALMYFATLTEIPILQGLLAGGMGKGPALALLLAGPALSLPNMLVVKAVIGAKKTAVFVALTIFMATLTGLLYGSLF